MIWVKLKCVALGEREPSPRKKKGYWREQKHIFIQPETERLYLSLDILFFFLKYTVEVQFLRGRKKKKTFQISHFRTKSLVFFSARRDDLNPTYPATRSQLSKPLPDKSAGPISQLKPRDIIFFLFFHTHYCRGLTE